MVRFLSTLLVCAAVLASDTADTLYKQGQRAEKAGDVLRAYLLYARAAALDPQNTQYAARKAALRGIAAVSSTQQLAPDPAGQAAPLASTLIASDLREANAP